MQISTTNFSNSLKFKGFQIATDGACNSTSYNDLAVDMMQTYFFVSLVFLLLIIGVPLPQSLVDKLKGKVSTEEVTTMLLPMWRFQDLAYAMYCQKA